MATKVLSYWGVKEALFSHCSSLETVIRTEAHIHIPTGSDQVKTLPGRLSIRAIESVNIVNIHLLSQTIENN